jgi:GDPmannose 4,6-dehydratase
MKCAVITGVTGQDGSFLSEFLLGMGYHVVGITRRASTDNTARIHDTKKQPGFELVEGDLCDPMCMHSIIQSCKDYSEIEVYNLAAQSHVQTSFDQPAFTFQVNTLGILGILEAVRQSGFSDRIKVYQAGTSEMFGKVLETPQSEKTPFNPRSPYGVSKVAAHMICKNYREAYGLFVCNGILFNHESERRGENFVTMKIVKGLRQGQLTLGNLDAMRDWGYARDYVRGMWLMLQQSEPDDYVLATGETHSVRAFLDAALRELKIVGQWHGEEFWTPESSEPLVRTNSKLFNRPSEVDILLGDASKARRVLGWKPDIDFKTLVKIMCSTSKHE